MYMCLFRKREKLIHRIMWNLIDFGQLTIKSPSLLFSPAGIFSAYGINRKTSSVAHLRCGEGMDDKGKRLIGNRIEFTCGVP